MQEQTHEFLVPEVYCREFFIIHDQRHNCSPFLFPVQPGLKIKMAKPKTKNETWKTHVYKEK
jgi:hypothetical protein